MRIAILLLAAACSRAAGAPRAATPAPPAQPRWSVAFERSIGLLATAPVFAPDGGVVSSGQRFDREGRYLGLLALEVGGGRTIANLRALLPGGRALAEMTGDTDSLLLGRADRPPEEAARARGAGTIGALAVSPDEERVAAFDGDAIQIWSLPALATLERIELAAGASGAALAFLPDGGLVYATSGGVTIRSARGETRQLRAGDSDAVAVSPGAALVASGRTLEVIALPGGASRGRIQLPGEVTGGITEGGALAIDPKGGVVAALVCDRLLIFAAAAGGGWQPAYQGRMARGSGDDNCAYPSGLAFSPDGSSLALVARDLTVLRPGPPRAPVAIAYRPALPAGFEPTAEVDGIYMPPPGTGLGPTPRVVGAWSTDSGAHARVVARDAAEMARFTTLAAWESALLTRFEPMVRDEVAPNRLARDAGAALKDRRAFIDRRGRRVLEYTLLVRGGCEEMDRRVRWIEDGDALVEVDLETAPGMPPAALRGWLAAFFDAPLGVTADARRRIASAGYNRGPC
jgi:hypothetical protein